jgi:TonB-dependent starch-binding outer membrane protein SusC
MRISARPIARSFLSAPLTPLFCLLVLTACARQSHSAPRGETRGDSVQVGYGAQEKEKVTGSVSTVPNEAVAMRPLRIETLLRGRVPGLQVVQGPRGASFRIRSTGTMLLDQEPLVIVDGVMIPGEQLETALAGLLPEQIRSVNVLKDVASTSVYGTRGAGGVIVVVTKK